MGPLSGNDLNVIQKLLTLFEGVVDVQQGQMVAVDVREPHFGVVGCFLGLIRSDETLRD